MFRRLWLWRLGCCNSNYDGDFDGRREIVAGFEMFLRMAVSDSTPQTAEKIWAKIYVGLVGLVFGLALLKFGNPVILDNRIEPPKDFWEFAIQSWPVAWGYWLLGPVALLGLGLARWKVTKPSWMLWLPLAWLMWQLVCATHTVNPELTQATLKHFVACVVCFYLGFFVLSEVRNLTQFWGIVFICFALVVWMGLDQHFGGLDTLRRFVYEQGHADQLAPEFLKKLGSNRIFSTLVYPNAFAGVILLLFPPLAVWLWNSTKELPNVVRGVFVGFFVYTTVACLYWSGSKSGWLIGLIMTLLVLWYGKHSTKQKVLIMCVLLLVGLFGFALKYSSYFERGASSVGARFDYWRAAIQVSKENPVWGSGPGTFSIPYKRVKKPESEMARLAHNDYLEQLSDSGIPGFFLYCSSIIGLLVFLYRKSKVSVGSLEFATRLGLSGWAMQEFVEFGLYIPAIGWTSFMFLGWLTAGTSNDIDKGSKTF